MTQPVVRALDVVDRLECDGRTLLLLEHRVVELNPLALAAYDAASEPVALDALTGTGQCGNSASQVKGPSWSMR